MSPDVAGSLNMTLLKAALRAERNVVINLPMAPTSNNLFLGTGKKRVKTAKYSAWCDAAGWELQLQRPPRIKGPVAVTIEVSEAESSNTWDVCNREKAPMDLLVTHGVIQGDNRPYVREVCMRWSSVAGIRITIVPLVDGMPSYSDPPFACPPAERI